MVTALSELFHVSAIERPLDWQPTLRRKTWDDPAREEIETALEAQRPENAPSRRTSYFAFGSVAECVAYAESEEIGPEPHFYRVKLIQAVRAPMTLEHVPDELAPYREAIYRHYWKPDDGWKVYEYFAERMVVVSKYADALPDGGPVRFKLMEDRKRLKQLAPTWK